MSTLKVNRIEPRTGDTVEIVGFGSGGLESVQIFTSSGTWTKPSGITKVMVEVQGGGGSGDDTATITGFCGAYSKKFIDVSSISTATVTVGAGGAGGGGTIGKDGGISLWVDGTNTISCMGGYGGGVANVAKLDSTPIVASGGDINVNSSVGNPIYGSYGLINNLYHNIRDAAGYGAGGGGNDVTYSGSSGSGSDGIVIVTEYK